MFLSLSVSLFTEGMCILACTERGGCLPRGVSALKRELSAQGVSVQGGIHPRGRHPSRPEAYTSRSEVDITPHTPKMATEAVGVHSTGIHFCEILLSHLKR